MVKEIAVPRIILEVLGVFLYNFRIPSFADVVKHVAKLHRPEPSEVRAVWVALLIRKCVVFPMNSDPLLDDNASC